VHLFFVFASICIFSTVSTKPNLMEEKRYCPECGDPVYGRIDKKFCSDQCRNAFNNKQMGYSNDYIRKVNGILRKNRKILEELNPNGKSKIHIQQLKKKGFDFEFHTNIYTTKSGHIYHFCYEHGYLHLENDFLALVKREN
jgi:predicted nucleic acid-binding Zn ribbon protein